MYVPMFVCMYLCLYVCTYVCMYVPMFACMYLFVCKHVSRSRSSSSQSAVVLRYKKASDVTLACQHESLWGFVEPISSPFGTPTMGDITIPRIMTEKPRHHLPILKSNRHQTEKRRVKFR